MALERPQLERRDTEGDIECNRSLERDRLKRNGAPRAPDQNVGTDAEADSDVAARAHVFASERAERNANCGSKYSPAEYTTCADTNVEPDHIECARIGLRWEIWRTWSEPTLHRLVACNNEADARVDHASQHTSLRP